MRNILICLLLTIFVEPGIAGPIRYVVSDDAKKREVVFRSEATLEDFEGVGTELEGWIELNPEDLQTLQGEFRFELESLDTGLSLRNKHMRENVLHTDDYPTAEFVITSCGEGRLSGEATKFTVDGTFSLHGVSNEMSAEIQVHLDGDSIQALASFDILLADYEIERPKMLVLKVAESVQLSVRALLTPIDAEPTP